MLLTALLAVSLAGPPDTPAPAGAYRTAADYRRQHLVPGGTDVTFPNKRGQLVVVDKRGHQTRRTALNPDSLWGFRDDKARTYRLFMGRALRLEQYDSLCVYSSQEVAVNGQLMTSARHYFFSRGLQGLVFPLTPKKIAEAYEAGSPAFVAATRRLDIGQTLTDYNAGTEAFLVIDLYRKTLPKPARP